MLSSSYLVAVVIYVKSHRGDLLNKPLLLLLLLLLEKISDTGMLLEEHVISVSRIICSVPKGSFTYASFLCLFLHVCLRLRRTCEPPFIWADEGI